MITGEYVAEVRDDISPTGTYKRGVTGVTWRPAPDLDPVPDRGDLATEQAAERLRATVAKLNREAGVYKYRTRYVPA